MIIAVDFDGTIVENRYPKIGREISFAIDTLKALNKQGHQLILWTVRSGLQLEEAMAYCEEHGVVFYAVNKSYPEEVFDGAISRKINADLFIDDRNFGGMHSWGTIYQKLCPDESGIIKPTVKKSFLQQIFGK
jgi:hypothetical protein